MNTEDTIQNRNQIVATETIIVTGFGSFEGIASNPSDVLVNKLSSASYGCGVESQKQICYHTLEVSVAHCSKFHDSIDQLCSANSIFVHIGVDAKGSCIKLEKCAYNNMTFRVKDEKGFQPEGAVICASKAFEEKLSSELPLQSICNDLNQVCGSEGKVVLSDDPGRFLCNYIYFRSLLYQNERMKPRRAVFVHIPPFTAISQEEQLSILKNLLELLSKC